ncbi:MAG: M1 family aminopeptidase [Flavobacteriales bacterium]
MKVKLLLPLFLFSWILNAQNSANKLSSIIEAEKKSALKIIQGERNPNTGNYDLKYHRLDLNLNPSIAAISGNITSYFEAKENLSQIIFELTNNMVVSQVSYHGNPTTFNQNANDEVVITLPQTINQGVLDSLTVTYSGNPESSGFGSFEQGTHNGDPVIWTLSEPYGAKAWWPCKQDLNDKIDSVDVYINAPRFNPSNEEYFAVSNGLEQEQTITGNTKITHFKHRHPIPAYLIAIAITNYEIYSHTVPNNGNPFDIINYVYPEDLVTAQNDTPVSVPIMNLYTNLFEEYPYADEKYGHAQFGWGGGMEHTTVSFMGGFSRGLIAHEMAHQWFGDKITCGSWQDIWLNEGFATYLAALVIEDLDGESDFKNLRGSYVDYITSNPGGSVYVPAQDTLNVSRVFNGRLSYRKGAMVLHMLRKKLGDSTFFSALQAYLNDTNFAFNYAKTEGFKAKIEDETGENLTEFFNDWVYDEGYPSYQAFWDQPSSNELHILLNQTQSHNSVSFFEASVPIRVFGTNGEILDVVLENNSNGQDFSLNVNFTVSNITINPDFDLITRNNTVVLNNEDYNLDKSISIFPNPATKTFQLQKPAYLTIQNIDIYSVQGKLVHTEQNNTIVHVESLKSGIYFLKIETNNGWIFKKLVKQ